LHNTSTVPPCTGMLMNPGHENLLFSVLPFMCCCTGREQITGQDNLESTASSNYGQNRGVHAKCQEESKKRRGIVSLGANHRATKPEGGDSSAAFKY